MINNYKILILNVKMYNLDILKERSKLRKEKKN